MGSLGSRLTPLDVLFLHVPKFNNCYRPIGHFSFILYPPIGLLGLADYLIQNQYTAKLIHLGVEQHLYGSTNLNKIISENRPALVGLDLHWHFQSYDVIEVARKIKLEHPEVAIVLGGFTASLFAEEILRNFPFVDFVIRGDAEVPLCTLVQRFKSDHDYHSVPNLSYRDCSGVARNPSTYTATSEILEHICFTDFTLMKDYQCFIDCFARYVHLTGFSEHLQRLVLAQNKSYQVYVGRGCIHNCSYCGGGSEAQALISERKHVATRSVNAIISSVCDLARYGFDFACFALDCFPAKQADDYYVAILEEIKKLDLPINIEVELYSLPSTRFIKSFSRLPGKDSYITLSPHTHNEQLRERNNLYRYSNQALEECLDSMEEHGVNCHLFFTCGLPFETRGDLEELAKYQRHIRRRYRRVWTKTCMIEIEPGSSMSRNSAMYDLKLERKSFADYYLYHSQPARNHYLEMGYERRACPDRGEVSDFFCRNLCSRFKAGWASPILCKTLAAARKVGAFKVIDRVIALGE